MSRAGPARLKDAGGQAPGAHPHLKYHPAALPDSRERKSHTVAPAQYSPKFLKPRRRETACAETRDAAAARLQKCRLLYEYGFFGQISPDRGNGEMQPYQIGRAMIMRSMECASRRALAEVLLKSK